MLAHPGKKIERILKVDFQKISYRKAAAVKIFNLPNKNHKVKICR
jgi:hypothetical protein